MICLNNRLARSSQGGLAMGPGARKNNVSSSIRGSNPIICCCRSTRARLMFILATNWPRTTSKRRAVGLGQRRWLLPPQKLTCLRTRWYTSRACRKIRTSTEPVQEEQVEANSGSNRECSQRLMPAVRMAAIHCTNTKMIHSKCTGRLSTAMPPRSLWQA